MVLVFWNTWR